MIYLDNHATTPCDPRVLEAMRPYFSEIYGNPSSSIHRAGRAAAAAVEQARESVARIIGADSSEIVFTAGATESNNLALFGLCNSPNGRSRIVTTTIEHKSILGPCQELERRGFDVVYLPVDSAGCVDVQVAQEAIDENTFMVSVQAANNEVGTIQPISLIADLAHRHGALVHCDAAQAVGKIELNVRDSGVDLLSMSAHKLYGPKGIGALYIQGGPFALPIRPLLVGGGQESGLRPGTLNVCGIVGFGVACDLCSDALGEESRRISELRDRFEERLLGAINDSKRNGSLNCRLPGSSSIQFPGIDAEALISNIPEIALSTGSACASGALEPSHVLLAIGLSRTEAYSTVRVGLGRFTDQNEIDYAVGAIVEAYHRLSSLQSSRAPS